MNNLAQTLNLITQSLMHNLPVVFWSFAVLWGVQIINKFIGYRLNQLGILPRHLIGLRGIVFSPFLHGSFEHLFLNSVVLAILLNLMLLFGFHTWLIATLYIVLIGGGLLWLFGRNCLHVGASGLIMGYWGFLLLSAYKVGNLFSILIALVCLYFFSSLIFNIFPINKRSSWEGHLFGLLAGLAAVYLVS
jgi:membrane associated rhomboid family serine protease